MKISDIECVQTLHIVKRGGLLRVQLQGQAKRMAGPLEISLVQERISQENMRHR